jgi:hypothetical protein
MDRSIRTWWLGVIRIRSRQELLSHTRESISTIAAVA